LIDGEGTIALTRKHAGEERQLVLSISSTEIDLLDWAQSATESARSLASGPSRNTIPPD
jgi:hypothetical protein